MSEDEKLLKEAKKLSWEDRLTHKNWKVRNDGNIDLAAFYDGIMDPKDPRLREIAVGAPLTTSATTPVMIISTSVSSLKIAKTLAKAPTGLSDLLDVPFPSSSAFHRLSKVPSLHLW